MTRSGGRKYRATTAKWTAEALCSPPGGRLPGRRDHARQRWNHPSSAVRSKPWRIKPRLDDLLAYRVGVLDI